MTGVRALCVLLALAQCRGDDWKVVETQQGPVKGYLSKEGNNFEFFGIPYATAPKGNDKFKAPFDPPSWTHVFEATNNEIICPQAGFDEFPIPLNLGVQNEDCLVINIFVPNIDKKNLPVLVHIHGGGFFMGSGTMMSHDPMLRHEVIAVNFNYRLGSYGFLCLGTEDVPGNAGLKDQVAALRWVKQNIARFGGNPEDVTINGGSAGSASVELVMLSPMAKGLFSKAIAESGSVLSPFALSMDPIESANRYIKDVVGVSADNIKEIEKIYKSLTIEQLTKKSYMNEPNSFIGFAPCIEAKIEGQESFLNDLPLNILKSGNYNKVPFMPGFATEEGLHRMGQFDRWAPKMEENFADFLPQDLVFEDEKEKKMVAAKVKKFYFKDAPVNEENMKEYVQYFTDVTFGYSTVKAVELHTLNSVPVYLYDFAYIHTIQPPQPHHDKINGADHCAQSALVHKLNFLGKHNYSQNEILMQDRLSTMWTNFMKFGTPVPSTSELLPVAWKRVDPERLNYLHIDLQLEAREYLLGESYKFWDDIYRKYRRAPIPPSDKFSRHTEL